MVLQISAKIYEIVPNKSRENQGVKNKNSLGFFGSILLSASCDTRQSLEFNDRTENDPA